MKKLSNDPKQLAIIQKVLLVVIVVLVVGTGWFAWHSKQQSDKALDAAAKTSNSASKAGQFVGDCTTDDKKMQGKVFNFQKGVFSICIPDGWNLSTTSTSSNGLVFAPSPESLTYTQGVEPVIKQISDAKVDNISLTIMTSPPGTTVQPPKDYYEQQEAFKATDISGTKYTHTQNVDQGNLSDAAPQGTILSAYYFQGRDGNIEIEYAFFPGGTDQRSQIDQVVKSIRLN